MGGWCDSGWIAGVSLRDAFLLYLLLQLLRRLGQRSSGEARLRGIVGHLALGLSVIGS